MKTNLHFFLGATVSDAAASPLHWVYTQKKLLTYITGKQDFTFLSKNKSPFYNIRTGRVSGYNDIGQVMFKTLLETHKNSKILSVQVLCSTEVFILTPLLDFISFNIFFCSFNYINDHFIYYISNNLPHN